MAENGAKASGGSDSDTERAEELLEEWGRRVGRFAAKFGARAREEAEDIWAEAQAIRTRSAGEG